MIWLERWAQIQVIGTYVAWIVCGIAFLYYLGKVVWMIWKAGKR